MDSKCILYIHCIKRLKCLLKMRSFVPTSSSSGADCAGAAADPHRLRGGGGLLPARAQLPAPAAGRECRNSDIDIEYQYFIHIDIDTLYIDTLERQHGSAFSFDKSFKWCERYYSHQHFQPRIIRIKGENLTLITFK